jgi:hypothetical protein
MATSQNMKVMYKSLDNIARACLKNQRIADNPRSYETMHVDQLMDAPAMWPESYLVFKANIKVREKYYGRLPITDLLWKRMEQYLANTYHLHLPEGIWEKCCEPVSPQDFV